jgi:hypothetical protein
MQSKAPLYPYPITSYAVILAVSILHLYKAIVLLTSQTADGNIPMHALLGLTSQRWLLAIWLIGAALPALYALWTEENSPWLTALLVTPQLFLLGVTAKGACVAIWLAEYADYVPRSSEFVGTDQYHRAVYPLIYAAAVYQKIRESAFNKQLSALPPADRPGGCRRSSIATTSHRFKQAIWGLFH